MAMNHLCLLILIMTVFCLWNRRFFSILGEKTSTKFWAEANVHKQSLSHSLYWLISSCFASFSSSLSNLKSDSFSRTFNGFHFFKENDLTLPCFVVAEEWLDNFCIFCLNNMTWLIKKRFCFYLFIFSLCLWFRFRLFLGSNTIWEWL